MSDYRGRTLPLSTREQRDLIDRVERAEGHQFAWVERIQQLRRGLNELVHATSPKDHARRCGDPACPWDMAIDVLGLEPL